MSLIICPSAYPPSMGARGSAPLTGHLRRRPFGEVASWPKPVWPMRCGGWSMTPVGRARAPAQCNPSPGWQTGRTWPWPCSAPGDFRRRFPKWIASPMLSYAPPAFFARGLHIPCTWFAGCVHLSCRCLARNRGVTPSCNANHFLATSQRPEQTAAARREGRPSTAARRWRSWSPATCTAAI